MNSKNKIAENQIPRTPPKRQIDVAEAVLRLTGKKYSFKDAAALKPVKRAVLARIFSEGTGKPAPTKVSPSRNHRSLNRYIGELMFESDIFLFNSVEELHAQREIASMTATKARILKTEKKRQRVDARSQTLLESQQIRGKKPSISPFPSLVDDSQPVAGSSNPQHATDGTVLSPTGDQPLILRDYLENTDLKLPNDAKFRDVHVKGVPEEAVRRFRSMTAKELKKDLKKLKSSGSSRKSMNTNWRAVSAVLSSAAGSEIRVFVKRDEIANNEVFGQLQSSFFDNPPILPIIVAYQDGSKENLVYSLLPTPQGKYLALNGPGSDLESGCEWRKVHGIPGWSERFVRLKVLLPFLRLILSAKRRRLTIMDIKTSNCGNPANDHDEIVIFDVGMLPEDESSIYHTFTLQWLNSRQLLGKKIDHSISLCSLALVALKCRILELPFDLGADPTPVELARAVLNLRRTLPLYYRRLVQQHNLRPVFAAVLCQMLSDGPLDVEAFETFVQKLGHKNVGTHCMVLVQKWEADADEMESQTQREATQIRMEADIKNMRIELDAIRPHQLQLPPGEQAFEHAYQTAKNREDALQFKAAHQLVLLERTHSLNEENARLKAELARMRNAPLPLDPTSQEDTTTPSENSLRAELLQKDRALSDARAALAKAHNDLAEKVRECERKDVAIASGKSELAALRKHVKAIQEI